MSWHRQDEIITICCDHSRCDYFYYSFEEEIEDARVEARRHEGWISGISSDFCPRHVYGTSRPIKTLHLPGL